MKTLETKRCILRPVTLKDTNELFECYKQDVVVKYLPIKRHNSTRDTKKFIKSFFLKNYKNNKIGHFAIVYKNNNKVIGHVGFNNISPSAKEGDIGICINPSYWGQNLCEELCQELLRYGFEELHLEKIIADIYKDNKYSKKTLEILGFTFEETFNKNISLNSHVLCNKYQMSKHDYFKLKSGYKV